MSTPPITTTSKGFGTAAFGTSPFGIGTPATVAAAPAPSAGSRYINPVSRDYEIAASTGQQAQMPRARQQVLLALMTVYGTSTAVPDFGLRAPRKIGTNFKAQTKAAARYALRHLTREDAPIIRIQSIAVDVVGTGRAVLTVSFFDIKTGQPDTARTIVQ